MKPTLFALSLCLLLAGPAFAAENPELANLQGKWECRKEENGQMATLTMEIKGSKLLFRMVNGTSFLATADLKIEKHGPFKTFTSTNIKVGLAEDSLQDVDEEYSHVYQIQDGKLYVTSNFDRPRDRAPALDIYRKIYSASGK
jgi:hypothetical protein